MPTPITHLCFAFALNVRVLRSTVSVQGYPMIYLLTIEYYNIFCEFPFKICK